MKSLWKRLTKENRKKIKSQTTLYPTTTKILIEELKSKTSYVDLRFESVILLIQELTMYNNEIISVIDNLFKHENNNS